MLTAGSSPPSPFVILHSFLGPCASETTAISKGPHSQREGRSMQNLRHTLTSESVSEGHPDKVCDYLADSILDAYLAGDSRSRVACEVLCKDDKVVLAGEITSKAAVDMEQVA